MISTVLSLKLVGHCKLVGHGWAVGTAMSSHDIVLLNSFDDLFASFHRSDRRIHSVMLTVLDPGV